MRKFGVEPVVVDQPLRADTEAEIDAGASRVAAELGVEAYGCDHWAKGGEGRRRRAPWSRSARPQRHEQASLYPDDMPLFEKIRTIAREIYRAEGHHRRQAVQDQLKRPSRMGYGKPPICVAKTQYSFSTNPDAKGAPAITRSTCARSGSRPAPSSWS